MRGMIEYMGIAAVTIMVIAYALEQCDPVFILIFAFGCALAAVYAWLIGSLPFWAAEGIWALIALHRWRRAIRRG